MLSKNSFIFSFLITALLLLAAPGFVAAQWFPEKSPTDNKLNAIAYQGAEKVFICGNNGTLLKKTSSQPDWQIVDIDTHVDLNDLIFPDSKTGYLAGDSGSVFKTENGGRLWHKLALPTQQELFSVFFTDSVQGWLAGAGGLVLKTADGGQNWQIVRQQEHQTLRKILFLNDSSGWAVGDSGLILKSPDGGSSWTQIETGYSLNLYDISFADSAMAIIAGADSLLLISSDGGASWQRQACGSKGDLFSVQAIDSLTWWLGGSGVQQGLLVKTFTAGKLWKTVDNSLLKDIYDVNFSSLYKGYAVGKDGHIFITETAGISMFRQMHVTLPQKDAVGLGLKPVFQWQPDGDARAYQLEIAHDAQFNHLVFSDSIQTTTFELPDSLNYFSTYFWRVRSLTVIGPSLWSEARSFRTEHTPPVLVSPANNLRDVSLEPVLQWSPTDGGSYTVEIARDADFNHLVFSEAVTRPSFQTPRLNYDSKYYWRVKFVYEKEESAWSETFAFTTLNGLNGWAKQFSGSNQLLKDVTFINNQKGWAVGTSGTILKTNSGGADWVPCNSGTPYHLESVYFFDEQNGLACGWNGTILKTANGGLSWQTVPASVSYVLRSITFAADSLGWAVGEKGVILKSTDKGASWSVFSTNPNQEYYRVFFIDANHGWIVGGIWNGHDYSPFIMETKNGGQNWNSMPFTGDGILRTVFFISPDSGWAGGSNGQIFRTLNGGMSWLIQQGDKNYNIRSLFFQSAAKGWAVGDDGTCLKTEDSGQNWSLQETGTSFDLADILFTDAEHGWIVGGHGLILKTASAGLNLIPTLSKPQNHSLGLPLDLTLHWLPVTGASGYYVQVADDSAFSHLVYENGNIFTNELFLSELEENRTYFWRVKSFHEGKTSDWSPARNFLTEGVWRAQFSTTRQNLNDILFKDLNSGVAVGDGGTVLRTDDGGETWKQLPLVSNANLKALCCTAEDGYWAVGDSGTILQSPDGGQSWQKHNLALKADLRKIMFTSENEGWAGGTFRDGQGSVGILAHTTDGGNNWHISYLDSLQILNSFVFWDDLHGLAAGYGSGGNMLRTDDGGNSWQQVKTDNAAEILTVFFLNGCEGFLTTSDGQLYASTDSGLTWTEKGELNSTAASDLYFIDSTNGFVLADGLYKTNDGGQSWQGYFADSLFNKIYFIDQNTGWLIGSNGLILKTTTAGSPLALDNQTTPLFPEKFELRQNFPNPFNPTTTISYKIGGRGRSPVPVRLTLFNTLGQTVKVLVNEKQLPGEHRVTLHAEGLASGIYIYQLQSKDFSAARKLILIR